MLSSRVCTDILKKLRYGIIVTDKNGNVIKTNFYTEEILGYNSVELESMNLSEIEFPPDKEIDASLFSNLLSGLMSSYDTEKRFVRKCGITIWVHLMVYTVNSEEDGEQIVVYTVDDVTARKNAELHLEHVSTHDGLTGIYNRAFFDREICSIQSGIGLPVSFIVIDVDGLKLINDTKGHESGDKLIINVANFLNNLFVEEKVFVSRTGGDEFTIIFLETNELVLQEMINKINEAKIKHNTTSLEKSFEFSIGGATVLRGADVQKALKIADEQMYQNKIERKAQR